MTLRKRLVLTTLAAAIPLLIAVIVLYYSISQSVNDKVVAVLVTALLPSETLDTCKTSPFPSPMIVELPMFRGRPFGNQHASTELTVFLYDHTGRSHQALAPQLPPGQLKELKNGTNWVGYSVESDAGHVRHLLMVLTRDQGPCAIALAVTPDSFSPMVPPPILLLPVLLALVAVLVGIGPIVRRVRALTLAVRHWREDKLLDLPKDIATDELGELSRALKESAETIQEQHARITERERTLREFVENTTHDLATPLTVLQGNLSALVNGHDPETVRQAMNEAQYLGGLLGNLALSAKFQAGPPIETLLDLRDIVLRVVDRHRSMAHRLEINIERTVPEEPVHVLGDPTFTEQALSNLINNSLRYNKKGGHVAVVLDVEGNEFVLRVLDDGPGLTADECESVTKRGERSNDARSRDSSGNGLGLSIVARVAQIQKWQFSLTPGDQCGLAAQLRGPTNEPLLPRHVSIESRR